ncbi:MAG: biotin--[acetyl-CoA-carboxylase] ligase [Ruminococcus sp.]|nr:biotin--[acetyl-CoA-carboxylase] ligase [Ruminococcus sp.]
MKLKDKVLKELEKNRGKCFSGATLAKVLGVSRTAVWKAIEDLRQDGIEISAVTNKGYTLNADDNSLSVEGIKAVLGDSPFDIHVERTVTSTNTVLKGLAKDGASHGYVLVAQQQTAGKGRLGRSFFSPDKTGIYLSVILRPEMTIENALYITTSAAVAVARAVETVSDGQVRAEIKWVNDIFIDGKKICGILTEASVDFESGGLEYAVLGIGVNILPPENDFPDDIKKTAASVFSDNDHKNIRNRLAAEILRELNKLPENYMSDEILDEYRKRSMLIGKRIFAVSGERRTPCTAIDIDEKARLIVRFDDGTQNVLSSGEVSIRLE